MLVSSLESWASFTADKKIKVAVIGCGSVSNSYLPELLSSEMIEVVSLCDIKYDRAVAQNKQYNVNAQTYPHIDQMLKGVPFDMMGTLTDMQVHEELNKKALLAGKNVWREKPLANTYAAGKGLLEHDNNVLSHVMCGFNFFDPHGHTAGSQSLHSIQIYGDKGNIRLLGYDWETNGVITETSYTEPPQLVCTDKGGYKWQEGAKVVGESMVTGIEPRINVEHALHVLEIIEAARRSQQEGRRIKLVSEFPYPVII